VLPDLVEVRGSPDRGTSLWPKNFFIGRDVCIVGPSMMYDLIVRHEQKIESAF
jgi:hypothetical protein